MELYSSRVATYPSEHFQQKIIGTLANHGFYYDDEARVSRCYQCGITFRINSIITHAKECPIPRQLRMQDTLSGLRIRPNSSSSSFAGRLWSFQNGWQYLGRVSPDEIAWAGFRFMGSGDSLECPFCKIIVRHSAYPAISIADHRRLNPHCPYVREGYYLEDPSYIL